MVAAPQASAASKKGRERGVLLPVELGKRRRGGKGELRAGASSSASSITLVSRGREREDGTERQLFLHVSCGKRKGEGGVPTTF